MTAPGQAPPGGRWARLAGLPAGRRTKWAVLALWLVLLALIGPLAGKLGDVEENDAAAWLPGGAESTRVVELQERFRAEETTPAVIVYQRPGGITAQDRAKAQADLVPLSRLPGAEQPQGPILAKDGQALQTIVPLKDVDPIKAVDDARDLVKRGPPGLEAHVTGPAGAGTDMFKVFDTLDGFLLMAAGIVVIVLLLFIYRSPVLWLVPVLSAVAALGLAQGLVYLLARYADLTVNGQSAGILTVLVFGVATDYALLLVARYREELHRHTDRHEAMAFALHRAGPAILASAGTVSLGLLCLLAADLNSTAGLGPVAAAGVVTALLAMTTLLPALLVILGRWVFWPLVPRYDARYLDPEAYEREHGVWARIARLVGRRPRTLAAVVALVLVGMTLGLGSLKAEGLSDAGQFVDKPDSIVGGEILARHYAAGSGSPAVVIGNASASGQLAAAISGTRGVAEVGRPVTAGGLVQYEATLGDRADSKAAQRTIDRLREAVHAVPGADAKVGGTTATNLDINRAASRDNLVIIPIVLVVVFAILVALLRALVAPLLMMATVVLSFLATLGASGLVFQHVFGFEGADAGFPLLAFIFLVALGVDYNIFLMHRVREESQALGTRRGVLRGLTVTGGVITSAGLVLAATFAALATLPLVSMVEMGFVVAFGVLVDTIVVRSLLLPALSYDLGHRIWAPSRLARREPPAGLDEDGRQRTLEPVG
ncbi:putative drug exporter of the RND superfamily [Thermomonospora echinospora]|uniref:Putative drug exporter of the RND superfamily n=1 Tax=Thermomonospora echinospora TaxID=1992 RepID=A0A1H6E3C6_9ACTN|nr:MMPL family transporter [Thermomonospora echinospora]SEG92132.1 putative drug exporter of the RND superfamily [Thermomonospora echinospora]